MEQIKELIEILKETPEMALWGISIYFLFILLKLASWVLALKIVAQQFIKRYFNYKESRIMANDANEILNYFDSKTINRMPKRQLFRLLDSMIKDNLNYIHESDIDEAIKKIKGTKSS